MSILDDYLRLSKQSSDIKGHLPFLFDETDRRPGCRVLELGTRSGVSTSAFLAAAGTGHVWSVDLAVPGVPDEWHDLGSWSFLRADALDGEALQWAPRWVDLLFIDLDPHSYEQTRRALNLWWPRVTPGGAALLHDTEFPEINGMPTPVDESEVGRAVADFCAGRGLEWQNRPGCFGMGVIRRV